MAVIVLISMTLLTALAVRQLRLFGEYAVEQNRTHILAQAKRYLSDKTHERSLRMQAVFRQAEAQAGFLASRVQQVLDQRDFYGSRPYNAGEVLYKNPRNNIFTNRKESLASCVYWDAQTLSASARRDITALSHVDPLLREVRQSVPGAVAAWLITKNAIARYYPNIHHVDLMPPVETYDYRDDLCYLIATPKHNPGKGGVWHEVYLDSMGQGLVITVSAPAYSKEGEFLASTGIDIRLEGILADIDMAASEKGGEGFSFVVDQAGRLIAFPLGKFELFSLHINSGIAELPPGKLLQYSLRDSTNRSVHAAAAEMLFGQPGLTHLTLAGEEYILAYEPMGNMGWSLGHVVPMREVLASVERTRQGMAASRKAIAKRYFFIVLAVLGCSLAVTLVFFSLFLFRPLSELTGMVRRVSEGDLDVRADVRRDDEFVELATALEHMAEQIDQQRTALMEARETYRELFDGAMTGLYRSTMDGQLLSVNESFAAMFGYESAEQMLREVDDAAQALYEEPEDRGTFLKEVVRLGEVREHESRMRRRDGSLFWMGDNTRVERDAEGEVISFVGSVVDITDRKKAEEYRGMLSRELIRIQETERRRLATDLHDHLAQDLSALKISFEMMLADIPEAPGELVRRLGNCAEMLRRSIAGVRRMAQGLGPFGLEELGLVGVLREYCTDFAESSDIAMDFFSAGLAGLELPQDAPVHVFRMVQEALNNIRRHANAETVKVRLVASHPTLIIRVEDDGQGFDVAESFGSSLSKMRMGLMSIRERARLLGGQAEIESVPGKGTRIVVEIPLTLQRSPGA